jgi:hypothetical protein
MTRINWAVSNEDRAAIKKIVMRYERIAKKIHGNLDEKYERQNLSMDITACHLNGTPLDLSNLLKSPDFDFIHDLAGISRHINRTNGRLESHFLPRCAI